MRFLCLQETEIRNEPMSPGGAGSQLLIPSARCQGSFSTCLVHVKVED